ncbi:hypothetical protein BACI9J_30002 [Bacillus altitudinis]|nr:hypothetical protein BACI9J_30002 [Bacillus altitudinis]
MAVTLYLEGIFMARKGQQFQHYSKEFWRISSAGRASALQAEGRRFEPVILHHIYSYIMLG